MIPFMSQVNRFTILNKWFNLSHSRSLHDDKKAIYLLKNRSLVKVSGPDSAQFLQGLITNDMNHFDDGAQSIYAMFLSNKGRVLYDTLIHKWSSESNTEFMLECDKSVQNLLEKHLRIYKLRRNVQIQDVNEMFKLWALITPPELGVCESVNNYNISVYKDPRLAELGYRLITSTDVGHIDIHQAVGMDTVIKGDEEGYHLLRYKLGVSEGARDLFPGACLPLEANCDYLHGVSFHKGCYIGQELTARVHHTGVVRKRIMPVQIMDIKQKEDLHRDAAICSGTINLGKFKGYVGSCGLGLVRIKEALQAKTLNIGVNTIAIIKPHWWPVEAPKEKLGPVKSGNSSEDIHDVK